MNYQKAWLELKSMIDGIHKNAHNPMSSMAEGVWTESITEDILKKMENIERNMLTESGFGELLSQPKAKAKTLVEKRSEMVYMKKVYLVKFKKSPIMQGHYGALVTVDGHKGSIERAIVREIGMLSTSVLSANIESIQLIGAKQSDKVKKDVVILTEHEYHSSLVHSRNRGILN